MKIIILILYFLFCFCQQGFCQNDSIIVQGIDRNYKYSVEEHVILNKLHYYSGAQIDSLLKSNQTEYFKNEVLTRIFNFNNEQIDIALDYYLNNIIYYGAKPIKKSIYLKLLGQLIIEGHFLYNCELFDYKVSQDERESFSDENIKQLVLSKRHDAIIYLAYILNGRQQELLNKFSSINYKCLQDNISEILAEMNNMGFK